MTTESDTQSMITDLPEGCVKDIISKTSPRDACRAGLISKAFHSAADSDTVWERFLPLDYHEIIGKAVTQVAFNSKKQLYHRLSDSYILLEHGHSPYSTRIGFKLDKESGKKCYMLGAKDLAIVWGRDSRYWEWGHVPESRFEEVGMLKHVWWLHIQGKIATTILSQKTTYATYLVYRITSDAWGLSTPGKTIVSLGGVRKETSDVCLEQPWGAGQQVRALRNDGWMEIELGEFYCDDGDLGEVEMVFHEHDDYKGGLILEGIELRPK